MINLIVYIFNFVVQVLDPLEYVAVDSASLAIVPLRTLARLADSLLNRLLHLLAIFFPVFGS